MRRAKKFADSAIILENLTYPKDSKRITEILHKEQGSVCAYTEEYLGRADLEEIEHFNPKLKNTDQDGYQNWFLVKAKWNREKSTKWDQYQPFLHPTAENFEARILYVNGHYILATEDDIEAEHLRSLLKLDDPQLAYDRKSYIARCKEQINKTQIPTKEYFDLELEQYPKGVIYLRALKEEFGFIHPNY